MSPSRGLPRAAAGVAVVLAFLPVPGSGTARAAVSLGGPTTAGNFALASPSALDNRFGEALASGDFDGDGRDDLVVGAPADTTGGAASGRIDLYFARSGGLLFADNYFGPPTTRVGWDLAAGDFDGNGRDEIAISRIGEPFGPATDAGKVIILGWDSATNQLVELQTFYQGLGLLGDTTELGDRFGETLAVGDFNGDGYDDLAVGVPHEDLGAVNVDQGMVQVLYGFSGGLTTLGSQTWTQDSTNVLDQAENQDLFGWSLAAGDFDGDGLDDLAIGVINEAVGLATRAGAVAVLYGAGGAGLAAGGNQLWSEGLLSLPGTPDDLELFGWSLAAEDFDGDGRDDLAIGVPYEDNGSFVDAGAVYELRGSATGLTDVGSREWLATDFGQPGVSGEELGWVLAAGHFAGGRCAGLAIGSPWARLGALTAVGEVDVVLGSTTGLAPATHTRWRATGLASGPPQTNDVFGSALASGDFDNDGDEDLSIGLPGRPGTPSTVHTGAVQVLRGNPTILATDLEDGALAGWTHAHP